MHRPKRPALNLETRRLNKINRRKKQAVEIYRNKFSTPEMKADMREACNILDEAARQLQYGNIREHFNALRMAQLKVNNHGIAVCK